MDVIKLLKTKNRCLERVLNLSIQFLEKNDLNDLDSFQIERGAIFKAIDLYDRKILEALANVKKLEKDSPLAEQLHAILKDKERLIREILLQDNDLMARIELKKRKILEDLAAGRKNHEMVGKFKSAWIAAGGEELDRTL